jgi:cell division transport system permease protein
MNRRVKPVEAAVAPAAVAARGPTVRQRLAVLVDQHLYSALSSLGRLWQRRLATALTVAAMALALALPLLLGLVLRNVAQFAGAVADSREISAFFAPGLEPAAAEALAARLGALANVERVALRTPADGLAELRDLAGFAGVAELAGVNPLPYVALVTPVQADAASVRALAHALEREAGVDFVQYDLEWRERLTAALALAERVVAVFATLLALGALLIVGNTIRLDVAARADEILIVQLIGGTDGFVRRPFLYAGVWYGLLAALLALAAVLAAWLALDGPAQALAARYGSAWRLHGPGAGAVAATLAAGIMLGWLGAWAACGRHLSRGRPR